MCPGYRTRLRNRANLHRVRNRPRLIVPRSALSTRSTKSASADDPNQPAGSQQSVDPPRYTTSAPTTAPARSPSHVHSAAPTRSHNFKRPDTLKRSTQPSWSVSSKRSCGECLNNSANCPPDQGAPATSSKTSPGRVDQASPENWVSSSSTMSASFNSSGDFIRAALSRSRPNSRRRTSSSVNSSVPDLFASTIVIEESILNSRSPSPAPSTTSKKSKVSKIDLLGEPLSDSSGSLSIYSDDREDVSDLMAPRQYAALPTNLVPRDQWVLVTAVVFPDNRSSKPLVVASSQLHQCR